MPAGMLSCWPRVDRRWPRTQRAQLVMTAMNRGVIKGFLLKAVTAARYVSHCPWPRHDRVNAGTRATVMLLTAGENKKLSRSGSSGCVIHAKMATEYPCCAKKIVVSVSHAKMATEYPCCAKKKDGEKIFKIRQKNKRWKKTKNSFKNLSWT